MIEDDAERHLWDTRRAFDSVAADYDGPRGNNALIQDMRDEMWHWLGRTFLPGARLVDLGCGTGLDAVHMAKLCYRITATDWSPAMLARTAERARVESVADRIEILPIGAHELDRIEESGCFDGAYSNLGPLNCVPNLAAVAAQCARLLKPGAALVFTVIGRYCPWEVLHYARRRRWSRIGVRFARHIVPVGMNSHTIWTHYYAPRDFYRAFREDFALEHYRGLCVCAPPPYLTAVRDRHPRLYARLWSIDRRLAGWPMLRSMGDHFLIVMRRH